MCNYDSIFFVFIRYIKEEDTFVFNNEINNPKVETIANEDDTSMNPENIDTSLLKWMYYILITI